MKIAMVGERVRQDCFSESNALGPAFFEEHIAVVADYSVRLAAILGGDSEIVELAALLHDISAVRDVATLPNHANLSAEIALEMLAGVSYPRSRAERVCQCIRSHSKPVSLGAGTLEEICVSNADAVAQIIRPAFWYWFAFGFRKLSFEDGNRWLRERIETQWAGMIDPARELAREGYDFSTRMLRNHVVRAEHALSPGVKI